MQEIDWELYQNNPFYRDLVDHMIENKKQAERLRQQRIAAQESLCAERARSDAVYRRQRMIGYANQLPYQQMTIVQPMQWSASYAECQNNFVKYWSVPTQSAMHPAAFTPDQEELRRAFHSAVDWAAQLSKEEAPVPSIIFDGLGVLTAGNLFEAAKSVLSMIDTAKRL